MYVSGWGWTVGCKTFLKNILKKKTIIHSFKSFYVTDVRSPSNVKRHVRIEAVHYDVCRRQYEKLVLNPVSSLTFSCQVNMSIIFLFNFRIPKCVPEVRVG